MAGNIYRGSRQVQLRLYNHRSRLPDFVIYIYGIEILNLNEIINSNLFGSQKKKKI